MSTSNTQTETRRPTPVVEDQIRDYRRYHATAQKILKLRGKHKVIRNLESEINPEQQLEISSKKRADLVPAEILYSTNWSEPRHRVYQHYSEQRILVTQPDDQENLELITKESLQKLKIEGMQHIHLGLVLIRIYALHRKFAGTKVLLVIRDTRWGDDKGILGEMEIDLANGTELVYFLPNLLLSIQDFYEHMEVVIKTKGYESWIAGESNLLITRGLVARLTKIIPIIHMPNRKHLYAINIIMPKKKRKQPEKGRVPRELNDGREIEGREGKDERERGRPRERKEEKDGEKGRKGRRRGREGERKEGGRRRRRASS